LLARLGRDAEACAEFERAASLTQNAREQTLLMERVRASNRKLNEKAAVKSNAPAASERVTPS